MTNITKEKINYFFSQFSQKEIPKGQIILHSGGIPEGVCYLTDGNVRQYVISIGGKELTIHNYFPGSFFPLFWAINNDIPDYNLEAASKIKLNIAPKDKFINWIKAEPEVLYSLSSRLLYGLSGLAARVEVLSLENSTNRLRSAINYLYKHFGRFNKHSITHEELASLTGLTRERVSIEMKKLKNEGVIDYKRGELIFSNTPPRSSK